MPGLPAQLLRGLEMSDGLSRRAATWEKGDRGWFSMGSERSFKDIFRSRLSLRSSLVV